MIMFGLFALAIFLCITGHPGWGTVCFVALGLVAMASL
jgi:hypothetical protein